METTLAYWFSGGAAHLSLQAAMVYCLLAAALALSLEGPSK